MIRIVIGERSDSLLALLLNVLRSDADLHVAGVAKTCQQLVTLSKRLKPDLIVLGMSIQASQKSEDPVREIMIESATPIVVVVDHDDGKYADASIRALRSGALAVVDPPMATNGDDQDETARQFISTLKAMSQVKVVRRWRERKKHTAQEHARPPAPLMRARGHTPVQVIAIAASTGGPLALQQILSSLPRDFSVPVLVVQHIATGFIHGVATWLATVCPLDIRVPVNREAMRPGTVYLAPDHHHMGVSAGGAIILSNAPAVDGFLPSATYLFESVGQAYGAAAVAVILTGMGRDGVEGLRALRDAGGRVIAQDESSCVVYGMPKAAVEAKVVDHVLPLSGIGSALVSMVKTL